MPVWSSVVLIIAFELMALVAIRDGLTLNIIQLIVPIEAIGSWHVARD
jgi:hypothetical protein